MKEVAASFGVPVPRSGLQIKVVATETFKTEGDVVVR